MRLTRDGVRLASMAILTDCGSIVASRRTSVVHIPTKSCGCDRGGHLVELPFPEITWERDFGIFTRRGGYIPTASQVLVDRIVQVTGS